MIYFKISCQTRAPFFAVSCSSLRTLSSAEISQQKISKTVSFGADWLLWLTGPHWIPLAFSSLTSFFFTAFSKKNNSDNNNNNNNNKEISDAKCCSQWHYNHHDNFLHEFCFIFRGALLKMLHLDPRSNTKSVAVWQPIHTILCISCLLIAEEVRYLSLQRWASHFL